MANIKDLEAAIQRHKGGLVKAGAPSPFFEAVMKWAEGIKEITTRHLAMLQALGTTCGLSDDERRGRGERIIEAATTAIQHLTGERHFREQIERLEDRLWDATKALMDTGYPDIDNHPLVKSFTAQIEYLSAGERAFKELPDRALAILEDNMPRITRAQWPVDQGVRF